MKFDSAHERAFVREEFDISFEQAADYLEKWKAHGARPGLDEYVDVELCAGRRREEPVDE
jgi:hypothetical protein